MKTLIYGTTIALLMSTSAMAQDNEQVRAGLEKIFMEENISVDPATLPEDVALDIYAATQGSDTMHERTLIEEKLRDAGYVMMDMEQPVAEGSTEMHTVTMAMPDSQLRDEVSIKLQDVGYTDVDVSALSEEEVTQVYLVLQSSDMGEQKQKIDAILNK